MKVADIAVKIEKNTLKIKIDGQEEDSDGSKKIYLWVELKDAEFKTTKVTMNKDIKCRLISKLTLPREK